MGHKNIEEASTLRKPRSAPLKVASKAPDGRPHRFLDLGRAATVFLCSRMNFARSFSGNASTALVFWESFSKIYA